LSSIRNRGIGGFRVALAIIACVFVATAAFAQKKGGGKGTAGEFRALGDQMMLAIKDGNLLLAENLARQRVALAEKGPQRRLGVAYLGLGAILRHRGRYADAEAVLRKALSLIEAGGGSDSRQAVQTLFNLGALYLAQSRYADAEAVLRDVLDRQLVLGPNRQEVIAALLQLANVDRQLGRYPAAEELLRRADGVTPAPDRRKGRRDEASLQRLRAQTSTQYAQLYSQQGRNAEAEARARQALAQFGTLERGRAGDIVEARTVLGMALLRLGRAEEAETVLREALKSGERALGREHTRTARAASGLALASMQLGRPADAERLLERAIDAQRKAGTLDPLVRSERAYARFLNHRKRPAEALEHYRRALDLVDRIFSQTQGLDEATREGFIGRYAPVYTESLRLLLNLHRASPDAAYNREALSVVSRTQSRLFTEMLRKADIGKLAGDAAFAGLRARQTSLKARLAEQRRARTLFGTEDVDAYDDDDEDEDDDSATAPPRESADPLVQARIEARKTKFAEEIAASERELAQVEQALWDGYPRYMELTQPRPVTVETLQKKLLKPDETLLTYYLLPDRVLIFLVEAARFRLLVVDRTRADIAALVAAARRPEEDAGGSLANLAKLDPGVLHELYRIAFQPVESMLKPGQRVLVIGDGPLHTLPLEMMVARWGDREKKAFADARAEKGTPLSEYATLAYLGQSYRFAYLPSLSALASVRLYRKPAVSYDRELVSFADPVFDTNGQPPQTRTALAALAASGSLRGVRPSSIGIPPLPETADEAREIAQIVGGRSELYLHEKAQEHTAKTLDLRRTRYLHFATHGLLGGEFLQVQAALSAGSLGTSGAGVRNLAVAAAPATSAVDSPLPDLIEEDGPSPPTSFTGGQPALVLSLSGDMRGEDGLLTMSEVIESLDLNARLVVLSACNTAGEGAEANNGEGFAGLTRAFMYAGAQGLLVSHWSVESRSTQELITEVFRGLRGGADSLLALERARERIRGSNLPGSFRASRAHPYFWAPFVYVGD
jgi:CHAT domain-containing protein/Tfp pilus assembly protein PilF